MWTVYWKEMRELLRDAKTFVFTILIPIMAIPAVFAGFSYFASAMSERAMSAELDYAVLGVPAGSVLERRLAQEPRLRRIALGGIGAVQAALDEERIKFALVADGTLAQGMARATQSVLTLYFNGTGSDGEIIRKRVRALVDASNETVRAAALKDLDMSQQQFDFVMRPIRLDEHTTAATRERAGSILGGILPYFLLMVCLLAAMYPAIDMGAGEKERGTLETLLLAPQPRSALVGAKFLVLFTVGLVSALLTVISMGFLLDVFGAALDRDIAAITAGISLLDLLMVAFMMVPTAAVFASILLTLSISAKSYKEAAGMMQPLAVIAILPAFVGLLPGVKMSWLWAAVPITNVSLALKELIKGTMDYRMFGMIFVSTAVLAGMLLALCQWWFKQESVLFRD